MNERKRYIGKKMVHAEPMTFGDFCASKDQPCDDPTRQGYLVIYEDGYRSWSPKDVFEAAYHEVLFDGKVEELVDRLIYPPVFPSDECSIAVAPDLDYGGAHRYQIQNSLGFSEGFAKYADSFQEIQFVQKNADGSMIPGVQSEQLAMIMLDRCKKLNARFPSEQNAKMIQGLELFLEACKERVQDRMNRGVMGDLKK